MYTLELMVKPIIALIFLLCALFTQQRNWLFYAKVIHRNKYN